MEPSLPHALWPEDAQRKDQGWRGWPWAALGVERGGGGVGCWRGGAVLSPVPPPSPVPLPPGADSLPSGKQPAAQPPGRAASPRPVPGLGLSFPPPPSPHRGSGLQRAPRGARISGENKERDRDPRKVSEEEVQKAGRWGGGARGRLPGSIQVFFQQKRTLFLAAGPWVEI